MNRRDYLAAVASVATVSVAGCVFDNSPTFRVAQVGGRDAAVINEASVSGDEVILGGRVTGDVEAVVWLSPEDGQVSWHQFPVGERSFRLWHNLEPKELLDGSRPDIEGRNELLTLVGVDHTNCLGPIRSGTVVGRVPFDAEVRW